MKEFIRKHKFIIFLFLFSFIVRLIYVLAVNTPIISDFKTMYDASIELLKGSNNYIKSTYFRLWGYQTGHVFYQYILLRIINSVTFLKIMNAIISSFSVVFIYILSMKFCSKKGSQIISIIYSLFPFQIFMNSVLTNQQLPLLLILISVYLLTNMNYDKYLKKSIIIGLILGISNILRSEGIVIITAILVYTMFNIKKDYFKKMVLSFIIILVCYLSIFNLVSYVFKVTNISKNGLKNMNPYWKFVTGLNYETDGMYSSDDAKLYSSDKNKAKTETINRLKQINKLPILFIRKSKILWYNSDLYWPIGHINNKNLYYILNTINQLFIIIFLILSIFSLKSIFKLDKVYLLSLTILVLYAGVYMLIEVMPRYAYLPQAFLAIISAYGIDNIINKKNKLQT